MKKILNTWEGKRYDVVDEERSTILKMVSMLDTLTKYGIIGIKQSFEDEGVILNDVYTMRRITLLANLDMFVKIGGAEAITDINNCANIGIDNVIAPMIETKFALRKFIDASKNIEQLNKYFVCETKTAYENIEDILNSEYSKYLIGVVVGRSDFTKSFDMDKSEVDSEFINEKVRNIMISCKKRNLLTTLGGNISIKSSNFIKLLHKDNLLNRIETRNVVIKLTDENIENMDSVISEALKFEMNWMYFKSDNYLSIGKSYQERADIIKRRFSNE